VKGVVFTTENAENTEMKCRNSFFSVYSVLPVVQEGFACTATTWS
jgi:hypothetical protein